MTLYKQIALNSKIWQYFCQVCISTFSFYCPYDSLQQSLTWWGLRLEMLCLDATVGGHSVIYDMLIVIVELYGSGAYRMKWMTAPVSSISQCSSQQSCILYLKKNKHAFWIYNSHMSSTYVGYWQFCGFLGCILLWSEYEETTLVSLFGLHTTRLRWCIWNVSLFYFGVIKIFCLI